MPDIFMHFPQNFIFTIPEIKQFFRMNVFKEAYTCERIEYIYSYLHTCKQVPASYNILTTWFEMK